MELEMISEWIEEENCAYRYILGTDNNDPNNRMAFIEKTPKIQIVERFFTVMKGFEYGVVNRDIHSVWIEGYKGNGHKDVDSRKWCDQMLEAMYGFNW